MAAIFMDFGTTSPSRRSEWHNEQSTSDNHYYWVCQWLPFKGLAPKGTWANNFYVFQFGTKLSLVTTFTFWPHFVLSVAWKYIAPYLSVDHGIHTILKTSGYKIGFYGPPFHGGAGPLDMYRARRVLFVGLRPVIQILCHVLARGWGRWLRHFTEAKAEVKYRASARIRGPKHDTRFEWPVSILIMTRYPFLPFKTHKTSAKNPRLFTIAGAIWFCRYRQCTPSRLWVHAPVAKEHRFMTSQYHIFDRTDNLNPRWM